MSDKRTFDASRWIVPLILGSSLMWMYGMTLAPGISWANYGADGGDLIAAAASGGVAHPTGYPLYLLIARVFQMLPFGSLAFRTNLMSALFITATSLVVYRLVFHSIPALSRGTRTLAGLASAYTFGLSPLVWSQAVITEVHALHALFVVLLLYLSAVSPIRKERGNLLDPILGLTFGLALGNHATIILLLPLLLISHRPRSDSATTTGGAKLSWGMDLPSVGRRFSWLAVGLLPYLSLPLRALSGPPVNWGYPVTPGNFWWLISAQLYLDQFIGLSHASVAAHIHRLAALSLEQFGTPGLVLGLTGLILYYRPSSLYHTTIWGSIVFSAFAVGFEAGDSFLYLIPACLCFSIWIGLAIAGIMVAVDGRIPRAGAAIGALFLVYLFLRAAVVWKDVDASTDLRAELFGEKVLDQAPEQALLFAESDRAVFTMWYFHYALQGRPDLALIATDLLPQEWYRDVLRDTYPDLNLPEDAPFPQVVIESNPARPVCFLREDLKEPLVCPD